MKTPASHHVGLGVIIVVVTAAVAAGLVLLGSPNAERQRRLDDKRVDDLRNISMAISVYWSRQKRLPEVLDGLSAEPGLRPALRDPATHELYEYHPLESRAYELCAGFQGDVATERPRNDFWSHGAGRQCFHLEAQDVGR